MIDPKSQPTTNSLAARLAHLSVEKRALFQKKLIERHSLGFDLIAQTLRECGITHIYGVAGKPTEELFPACLSQEIRPIGVYHQTSAVCMAIAHNYQAGRLVATTLLSAGPAVTNAMTGLLVARENGWPVIVLGGRRSSFQNCNILPMVRQVTKQVLDVSATGFIDECIREACQIAVSGRPGPVYVELHEDVLRTHALGTQFCKARSPAIVPSIPLVSDQELERIACDLVSARRPALLLGKGVRWTVVPEQLQELIDLLDLAFITSPMGRGTVSDDHPLCFNRARSVLQSQADMVLIIGARLNWIFRHGTELSRKARVLRVDIHRDDEVEAAIETDFCHADAGDFVSRLLSLVKNRQVQVSNTIRRQQLQSWHHSLRSVCNQTQRLLDQRMNSNASPMSAYRMMKEIRDSLPRDAICISDGNVSMMVAQQVIPGFHPASRMDAGTNGCMGVGIPFAIGAKVACPNRPVVAVTGDYGFSLSAMEMEVCLRHGIPIVIVVANNQGNNGSLKQKKYFPGANAERVMMFESGLEYDRVMKIFGGQGITISDPELIKPALQNALAMNTPCCINIMIDPATPMPNAWGEQGLVGDVT